MNSFSNIMSGVSILLIIVLAFILRPVPIVTEDEANTVIGFVTEVKEGGTHDIVMALNGIYSSFYINRGRERGLQVHALKEKVLGKEVEIKYPSYWTPLDPASVSKHVSKLTIDGEVIFNELKHRNRKN